VEYSGPLFASRILAKEESGLVSLVGAADEILMITGEGDIVGGMVPHCCSCSVANSCRPA